MFQYPILLCRLTGRWPTNVVAVQTAQRLSKVVRSYRDGLMRRSLVLKILVVVHDLRLIGSTTWKLENGLSLANLRDNILSDGDDQT